MFTYQTIDSTGQKYYLSGQQPRIFILSGTHGDEWDIVPLVEQAVAKYAPKLPDFLYIPVLSPSAVAIKTRKNGQGVDLNRSFYPDTKISEAQEIMKLLQPFKFDLVLNFHGDPALHDFYVYDTKNITGTKELANLQGEVKNLGVGLFNGVDDPDDPMLGYKSSNGYIYYTMDKYDGGIDSWLKKNQKMDRQIMPEIPGQVSLGQKSQIIDIIFNTLVLPFYAAS